MTKVTASRGLGALLSLVTIVIVGLTVTTEVHRHSCEVIWAGLLALGAGAAFWDATKKRVPSMVWLMATITWLSVAFALQHSTDAIISFDEGFRGGAAQFYAHLLNPGPPASLYLREFFNGVMIYPPLWAVTAGVLGALTGGGLFLFRAVTLLFYVALVLFTYWFSRRIGAPKTLAALLSAAVATSPLLILYNHLMMLEVPLALGVTASIVLVYLYAEGKVPRTRKMFWLVTVVVSLGALTKIIAWPVTWAVLGVYAFTASLLFSRQQTWKNWLRWDIAAIAALSLVPLALFIAGQQYRFGLNLLSFHLSQTDDISGRHGIVGIVTTMWNNRSFYLRDFHNMPQAMWLWFTSLPLLAVLRRDKLSWLLLLWTFVTYAIFSAVLPQVPQYIMPMYVPLALGFPLLAWKIGSWLPNGRAVAIFLSLLGMGVQLSGYRQSETGYWRTGETGQVSAARVLAAEAGSNDRIATMHDGMTYIIRDTAGNLPWQIQNRVTGACQQALVDSIEWMALVQQPPLANDSDLAVLNKAPWVKVGTYGRNQSTALYRNTGITWPTIIKGSSYDLPQVDGAAQLVGKEWEQPLLWGCYRLWPEGKLTATAWVKPVALPADGAVLKFEYAAFPYGESAEVVVETSQLKLGEYQPVVLPFERVRRNLQGEFRMYVADGAEVLVDRIEVRH